MSRIRHVAILLFLVLGVCGCATTRTAGTSKYDLIALGITSSLYGGSKPSELHVIHEQTSIGDFVWGKDKDKALQELEDSLSQDFGRELARRFIEANRTPTILDGKAFPREFSVKLLSDSQLNEIFKDGADKGWRNFYEKFGFGGIYTVSHPVFSANGKRAMMMIWNQVAPLGGRGGFLLFERIGSVWLVKETGPSGVS